MFLQVPLDVSHFNLKSLLGLMCYLFHVAVVYVLVGEIMSNHSYNFCMEGVLNAFFFWLFRWVTLDEMAFMSALHANQKPSTSAWHNHRAYCPYAFHLAMLPAFWCWWWGNRLPAKYTFCHLFCWRIRTTINTSSPYCFSLLSSRNVKPAPQWAIKRKIQYCMIPMWCCV